MNLLQVLFFPIILTISALAMIYAHFRKKRRLKKKKLSVLKDAPLPVFDARSGFDEGVIG